ncbi:tyrosine-type recombinase/integrase [uncultured Fusobacterium sp.]|uniref:tyrosine-type recombinase/integrase n=1 Tax=uncultured Fusobacterium sp. TaxID=159267 RepID=UPI0025E27DE1|nr:tyrosine-type recombinase/integrase [uncultured Fusobacterium sp.]
MKISEKNQMIYQMYLDSKTAVNSATKETTYRTYKNSMSNFMEYLHKHEGNRYLLSDDTLKKIIEVLERYIIYCRNLGNNNRTINGKLTAISSFYKWAVRRDLIKHHPFRDKLDRLKVTEQDKRRESYFLTWKQIFTVSLLMELDPKKFDTKSRLLWELFLDSGFRISAVHSLKISQLDLENNMFRGVTEKMGKVRDLFFFSTTKKLILQLLEERKAKGIELDYLFTVRYNNKFAQMSQTAIRRRVRKMGALIGIPQLYPHSLRKTAINQINNLSDTKTASEFAGHSSTKVTEEHYIQHKSSIDQQNRIFLMRKNAGLM